MIIPRPSIIVNP
jgi:hypothetical protein